MSDTLIGSLIGAVVVLIGGVLTWLATRGKTRADATLGGAQLQEQKRQADINLIIKTLQEQVEDLQVTVREQHQTIKDVQAENRECLIDRDQMRGEIRRLTRRLGDLERHGGGEVGE